MMGSAGNNKDTASVINDFGSLIEVLSNTVAGLIDGRIEPATAREISRTARGVISAVQVQLNYVQIMGKKPEGNFSELFKSETETPHTADGNGNGNGRRKTARPLVN